ncbi:MAG: hypothetical protein F4060_10815 [Holophagales bacterium]|nr:hypothetical protein [Holophagales bacterium]MYG31998.1 hypothetical protein [Holophagales bacterium]MYI80416.1 hypothetical protein [Holophagales bacterium]
MKKTLIAVILTVSLGTAGVAQEHDHPDSWRGPWLWTSAKQELTVNRPVRLLEALGSQSASFDRTFGSAHEHGLHEGQVPDRGFCPPRDILQSSTFAGPDSAGQFDATVLLSEVAVTATVSEVIPGFTVNGAPVVMLHLTEVLTLHGRSPSPLYALVPVGQLVVDGRIYCSLEKVTGASETYQPEAGTRVVVIGPWASVATVPIGFSRTSAFAVVEDHEKLSWKFYDGPETMAQLRTSVGSLIRTGLLAMTEHLRGLEEFSAGRPELSSDLFMARRLGCDVVGAEKDLISGELTLSTRCPE